MSHESDGESSGEYFMAPFKNRTEKHGLDATHSIEGVRTLFMMHEAMSELRSELLKKDQELLALKRDLEEERARGMRLASDVGCLRRTVFPSGEGSAKSSSSSPARNNGYSPGRHTCSVLYSINRGSSGYGSEARFERAPDVRRSKRCVKRGVWEVAALARFFDKRDGLSSSLPNVAIEEDSDFDPDGDSHSTCSTTSLLAAAESYKAVCNLTSEEKYSIHRVSSPFVGDFGLEAPSRPRGFNVDVPVLPRKPRDILPGCRVKYFHPEGHVLSGVVVQIGSSNGRPGIWVWCTRERSMSDKIVAVPWTKIIVCFRKSRREPEI